MLKVLILLSFVSFATSQNNFNISAYDSQLQDIFNGLIETEKKIGSFLSNLSDFVGKINGNLKSNKSRLNMDLSHLQLILQLQSSIKNHETYQKLTGCENVASKISEIDVDLKKFSDFVNRLELNMTELYLRNLYVTYDLIMRFETSQEAILDLILGVNEAMVKNLFYILQLQVNIQHEKSISTNLKLFLKHYCECGESVYGVSRNTNTRPPLSEMEATVTARQARVINSVNETLMLIESKNFTKNMKVATTKLTNFCRKMIRIDDYSNISIPATNTCSELTKVQDFMTYRQFHYTQVLSFVMTNSSILGFYKNMINTSISNVTADSNILTAVINLETELKNYTDDLAIQLSYLTLYASTMRRNVLILKLFCGCRVAEPKTTTELQSSTEKISTPRKLVFSTGSFLTTNQKSYEATENPVTATMRSLVTTSATSETKTAQKSTTNVGTPASTSTFKNLATTPGSSASTSVSQTTNMSVNSTILSTSSILTTKPSTAFESSTKPTTSTSSGIITTPNPSISTPQVPPTLPSITTTSTSAPFSPSICSFTKTLTDMNGIYIKSACLVEISSNGSFANSSCQGNSMQLMTIDSNMTQTALNIFVQETLSEGIFWIGGGNGTDLCNFVVVNGTGSVIKQDRCNLFDYYSICEYKDPNVPKKVNFPSNLDACGLVFPVMNETVIKYTRYGCIMAYTRSYIDSSYNCMINGMQLFNISPKTVILTVNQFLVSFYGNNSGVLMWANAPVQERSCSFLDGSKVPFEITDGNCDQLYWSICEAPYDGSY